MMTSLSEQQSHWNKKAGSRRTDADILAGFAGSKIDFLLRHVPGFSGMTALEVGAGDGYISRFLMRKTRLMGLDLSTEMLRQNPLEKKIVGSVFDLPFGDDAFDLVLASNLLHHLEAPEQAVMELARVSRGYVVLCEPNCRNMPMYIAHRLDPAEKGALKFSLPYLTSVASRAGLFVIAGENVGWVAPNKTPKPLLIPLLLFESFAPSGLYSMVVGKPE